MHTLPDINSGLRFNPPDHGTSLQKLDILINLATVSPESQGEEEQKHKGGKGRKQEQ